MNTLTKKFIVLILKRALALTPFIESKTFTFHKVQRTITLLIESVRATPFIKIVVFCSINGVNHKGLLDNYFS